MRHNFESVTEKCIGRVLILKGDSTREEPWTPREYHRISTIHRLRWIVFKGAGKKVPGRGEQLMTADSLHIRVLLAHAALRRAPKVTDDRVCNAGAARSRPAICGKRVTVDHRTVDHVSLRAFPASEVGEVNGADPG